MQIETRPNKKEIAFLSLSYNRFYDIFDEAMQDEFWSIPEQERFFKIMQAFLIYGELLNYEPIQWTIEEIKKRRPPMEGEIGSEVFKFIRNTITHFPFYSSWDSVWINKDLVNWDAEGRSIDRFLKKYSSKNSVKYRLWEEDKKRMTYLSINFPKGYQSNSKIYLKDILSEKEGVKFSLSLMRSILDTQVERQ